MPKKDPSVVVCEFWFEKFSACGSDEHLDELALRLDRLLAAKWVLTDATRDPVAGGWWRLCFYREASWVRTQETARS